MTSTRRKNIAASVHQRLLDKARESERPFNELFQYYAIERCLYRFSKSSYAERFILKGALMLIVWESPVSRPTMDIDMLGKVENSVDAIVSMVREVCLQEVDPDGIVFDPKSTRGERITEDADYEGVRVFSSDGSGAQREVSQLVHTCCNLTLGEIAIAEKQS